MTVETLQRAFVATAIAVAIAASALFRTWWALLGTAALVAFGYAAAIATEFLWLAQRHGEESRPPAPRLIRAWAVEVARGPRVFGWLQPFRHRAVADLESTDLDGVRGVVLVHGFFCNRAIWTRWMRRLRRERIPYVAVDLRPVFGSIDRYAGAIDDAVRRMTDAGGGRAPVVVAHSMGGIATRAWLSRAGPFEPTRVHRIVTIGSPHGGTWLARFARAANGREMQIGSPFLAELQTRETPQARSRFICYWSDCDNIVFPSRNATLEGADNRGVVGYAHVHLVEHPAIVETVLAAAREPDQMS